MLCRDLPGKEGSCHISELSHARVHNVRDVCQRGDMLEVKVLDVNDRGQIKLSHKALLPPPPGGAPGAPMAPPPRATPSHHRAG